jgi:hypothetical protein
LKRELEVFLLFLCLFGFGCRSGESPSAHMVSPLTGSNVGQKMPSFTARDQFGRVISSDQLKGSNGTALLFYRSADW